MSQTAANPTEIPSGAPASDRPLWPKERAFVLQLSADSEPGRGKLVGRLEHVNSGRVGRFDSAEGLLAALEHALASTTSEPPASDDETAAADRDGNEDR